MKFIKKSMSVIFFSLFFNGLSAQTKDSLNNVLTKIEISKLKKIDVEVDASKLIDGMISDALSAYEKKQTEKNFDAITSNFKTLIDKIIDEKVLLTGNVEGYKISTSSIKKAKKTLCPLYPFCN